MVSDKSERLLNLLIMLLVQRHYVPKEKVRSILYADSGDEAFEKMFERDKDDLRSLGVPIEVGHMDAFFDDEPGYRIRPDELQLPEIELAADEAAVIALASRVWEHAKLAEATTEAVRKLTAFGLDVDVSALDIVEPRLSAEEPSFDIFWESTQDRTAVEFDYTRPGQRPARRHLQPWGVVRYAGRWYAVGYDTDRSDERIFRLSRVQGDARRVGRPGAYEIPPGVDIHEVARRLAPPPPAVEPVTVLVREGQGHALRRSAARTEAGVPGPDTTTGWDRLHLERGGMDLADELLTYGPAVYVESPVALRDLVVSRLRQALAEVGA